MGRLATLLIGAVAGAIVTGVAVHLLSDSDRSGQARRPRGNDDGRAHDSPEYEREVSRQSEEMDAGSVCF
ncbi:MAG: hypothetical protein IJD04_02685 [Desulfovibrionaceae bacterium]|nr:hypothetical protein [Desulfovibrionaceae bacterium]